MNTYRGQNALSPAHHFQTSILGKKKIIKLRKNHVHIAEISARGEVSARILLLIILGIFVMVLAVGSMWISFKDPEHAKDIWVITGPIMSAAICAPVGQPGVVAL